MALGGGTFTVQNKVLPGAYINFVSAANASAALSDRGVASMALELDWGPEGTIFEVTSGDFQKNSLEIFGYAYTDDALKGLRDLFKNARTLLAYRLNGGGKKAANEFAEARYTGTRGNGLRVVIAKNGDDESLFDVTTLLGTAAVDVQTVAAAGALADNAFLHWKADAVLAETAGVPLSGGENGTADSAAHQAYLDKMEAYACNTMGAAVTDEAVKGLYAAFCKRMREEMGVKFQLVLFDYAKADYYGVISVKNAVLDEGASPASLVYWVTGASAGCAVNRSNQNKIYDGEFAVDTAFTQAQLAQAIAAGEFVLHKVGDSVRVLDDINTMVSVSDTRGAIFRDNQTVRVIDQIANDIAVLFRDKYLGVVPNDAAGRVALWADIVAHHRQLEDIRAIENFSDSDVEVLPGDTKKSVVVRDAVTTVSAMSKIYMTVTVS